MKTEKSMKSMKKIGKAVATRVAEHYANVTCPLVVFQPKMTDSVKRLRKF